MTLPQEVMHKPQVLNNATLDIMVTRSKPKGDH